MFNNTDYENVDWNMERLSSAFIAPASLRQTVFPIDMR
jgi:hypothetical protein